MVVRAGYSLATAYATCSTSAPGGASRGQASAGHALVLQRPLAPDAGAAVTGLPGRSDRSQAARSSIPFLLSCHWRLGHQYLDVVVIRTLHDP